MGALLGVIFDTRMVSSNLEDPMDVRKMTPSKAP